MTNDELEAYASEGRCPERLQALAPPGEFTELPALPGPAVNRPVPAAGMGPRHGGNGGRR